MQTAQPAARLRGMRFAQTRGRPGSSTPPWASASCARTGRGQQHGRLAQDRPVARRGRRGLRCYAEHTQGRALAHAPALPASSGRATCWTCRRATHRNLELTQTLRGEDGAPPCCRCSTPDTGMGSRALRHWLTTPRDRPAWRLRAPRGGRRTATTAGYEGLRDARRRQAMSSASPPASRCAGAPARAAGCATNTGPLPLLRVARCPAAPLLLGLPAPAAGATRIRWWPLADRGASPEPSPCNCATAA